MRTITKQELEQILADHKKWSDTRFSEKIEGSKADLREADLRGADLYGADLSEADLREVNLRGVNLREADLRGANLCGANLYGADLRGADLYGADLSEADLRGANLREVNLYGADLRGADLHGAQNIGHNQADFRGFDLDFCSIPLSCRGLKWGIDRRLAVQLLYHFCSHKCDDAEITEIQNSLLSVANQFHRTNECGILEPKEPKNEH